MTATLATSGITVQATFSLEDDEDDPVDDAVDDALTVSADFFSDLSDFSVEEPLPESLVLDSVAFAGVAEELPLRLSVR
jgi:hypothetical protein